MRRFSLIGRLGPDDKRKVNLVQSDSDVFEIDFLDGDLRMGFGIGHALDQLASLGLLPSERAIDLVVLAALVNAGDTRVSRKLNAQDGWTREIDLYIPVSTSAAWTASARSIESMLRFLSGDRWRVFFRDRTKRTRTLAVAPKRLAIDELTKVSLLSGGLDSLIGAVDLLSGGERPLFVSHYWDSETAKAQAYILNQLETRFGKEAFKSLRVRLGFDKHHLVTGETENTQRGRSFLFYSLATLAASAIVGQTTVDIPENGLIALNVPLDPLRFGALSTRTAHPHFIASMQRLIDALALDVELNNPYRHMTKGEMVANCADKPFLEKIVANSMSCSSPAKARYKKLSPRHCGYCVPCLIRRASLEVGLDGDDETLYTVENLKGHILASDQPEGEHVRSFQLMAKRIKAKPGLAKILVHKPGPLHDETDEIPDYADVFRRGVLEVAELLKGVRARPGG
ncbi:Qat anti-phage system QueC-like protein QatC [Roseibium marinum]|uniref:7-cyano-7-deazaguanine synthase in queuosine biosynthesis n=1 Tax=Roseibium marinum TaxID=281252 RepID=A0A2S3V210_9HYPH|nr:Qat anti-phage system QueC-like protein QatC [Roseibium marinum]POF33910.1 7-cyano-7-deazaguanine synthase in queuosine biosynthesis [Roseibium marinum]